MKMQISMAILATALVAMVACSAEMGTDGEVLDEDLGELQEDLSLLASTTYHRIGSTGTGSGTSIANSGVDPFGGGATICQSSIGVLVGIAQNFPNETNTRVIACRGLNSPFSLSSTWVQDAQVVLQTQAQAGAGKARMFRCPAGSIARGWNFNANKPRCQVMKVNGGPWTAAAERHEGDPDENYQIIPSAYTLNGVAHAMHVCRFWSPPVAGAEGAMVGGFQSYSSSLPGADFRYRCAN